MVAMGHGTVPLGGQLSSLCSLPDFAEVNGGIPFVGSYWCLWHHSTWASSEYIWHQSLINIIPHIKSSEKAL